MADDNRIEIQLGARIDEFIAGLAQAGDALRQSTEGMRTYLEGTSSDQARIQLEQVDTAVKAAQLELAGKKQAAEAEYQAGALSAAQKHDLDVQYADQAEELEKEALDAKLQLLQAGSLAYQKVLDQELLLAKKHANDLRQIDLRYALDQESSWRDVTSSIESSLGGITRGILQGTQSWRQVFARALDDLLASFADIVERMLIKWVEKEFAMTAATQAGDAARTASDQAASAASAGGFIETALKTIATDSAQTFGGVFAFLSSIMGPAAAGPAAAAQAEVLAAGGIVGFAAGAWDVPANMVALLHQGETVLPRPFAEDYRAAAGNRPGAAAPAAAGGGHNFNITVNAQSAAARLTGQEIAAAVAGEMRKFSKYLTP